MLQNFEPGDFLIFQLESGYALIRVLAIEGADADLVWHLAAYNELFLDTESADNAIATPGALSILNPHVALTNHAFESTQVAKLANHALTAIETQALERWRGDPDKKIHDRSFRLLLGLR
jgi:hypothetical protein